MPRVPLVPILVAVVWAASLGALPRPAHAQEATRGGVTAANPWVRATPGGVDVSAAYLEIKTAAGVSDRLLSVSSPLAARTELHTHEHADGIAKMRRVDAVSLLPGTSTLLKPMGDHIMLIGLVAPLREGDRVPLALQFEKAGKIEVEAKVARAGAMEPHGAAHQPSPTSSPAQNSGQTHRNH